jgi:outer membrane protein TolC
LLIGEHGDFNLNESTTLPEISCERPDLKAQELSVKFAESQLNATRWSFWPQINLLVQGLYTTNTQGFINEPLRGAILLQASWTIFDGYYQIGKFKERRSQIHEQRIRLGYLQDQIHQEQVQYEQSVKLKEQALQFSKKQLDSRADIYKQTEIDLKSGLANTLDLIDASQKLTEAEIEQSKAIIALSLSKAQLGYSCSYVDEGYQN